MFYISLWASKIYLKLIQKYKSSDRVGLLANKLDKDFLKHLKKPKMVICVTGTNGKTTTCNLLFDYFKLNGYKVACNSEGYNEKAGISKTLLESVNIFNQSKVDIAIIEFNELRTKEILSALQPNYLLVSNLSEDTIKRNGHVDYVYQKVEEGIPEYTSLILNGDDIISSQLGMNNKRVLYSIKKQSFEESALCISNDVKVCPKCLNKMSFDFIRYQHIGFMHCVNCGFTNQKAEYIADKIDLEKMSFKVNGEEYPLVNAYIHNIYNELAIIALLKEMGVKDINLSSLHIDASRVKEYQVKGKKIIKQMVKGGLPMSVNRSFEVAKNIKGSKDIIFFVDDIHDNKLPNYAEIITSIYDCDYELLNDASIRKIIIGGQQCFDQKLRFLLAGIKEEKLVCCIDERDTYKYIDLDVENYVIIPDLYLNDIADEVIEKIKEAII